MAQRRPGPSIDELIERLRILLKAHRQAFLDGPSDRRTDPFYQGLATNSALGPVIAKMDVTDVLGDAALYARWRIEVVEYELKWLQGQISNEQMREYLLGQLKRLSG